MFPVFRQRLLIGVAAVLGGVAWLMAAEPLGAADASSGISLFDAHVGVLPGLLLLLLAGLPALVLGGVVSATGHPLAGVFTLATGLTFLAGAGGSIEGYMWRHTLPGGFGWLGVEALLWVGLVVATLAGMYRLRPVLRGWMSRIATEDHWGKEVAIGVPDGRAVLAGVVCLAAGGALAAVLLQREDTGQVIGSLILAFAAGGLLAQVLVPHDNPVAVLLSPLALGVLFYCHAWLAAGFADGDAVLGAWYRGDIWGPAMVMPIFYASAGVTGSAAGIGLGQAINHAREQAITEQQ